MKEYGYGGAKRIRSADAHPEHEKEDRQMRRVLAGRPPLGAQPKSPRPGTAWYAWLYQRPGSETLVNANANGDQDEQLKNISGEKKISRVVRAVEEHFGSEEDDSEVMHHADGSSAAALAAAGRGYFLAVAAEAEVRRDASGRPRHFKQVRRRGPHPHGYAYGHSHGPYNSMNMLKKSRGISRGNTVKVDGRKESSWERVARGERPLGRQPTHIKKDSVWDVYHSMQQEQQRDDREHQHSEALVGRVASPELDEEDVEEDDDEVEVEEDDAEIHGEEEFEGEAEYGEEREYDDGHGEESYEDESESEGEEEDDVEDYEEDDGVDAGIVEEESEDGVDVEDEGHGGHSFIGDEQSSSPPPLPVANARWRRADREPTTVTAEGMSSTSSNSDSVWRPFVGKDDEIVADEAEEEDDSGVVHAGTSNARSGRGTASSSTNANNYTIFGVLNGIANRGSSEASSSDNDNEDN